MTETYLIPVDLRVASLNTLKMALEQTDSRKVNLLLIYPETLGDSISDLLFRSPAQVIRQRITHEFKEGLEILRNRFESKINTISIELFQANNRRFMKNFLEAHSVVKIFVPKTYSLSQGKSGFDPVPLLKQSGIQVQEIEWEVKKSGTEKDLLNDIYQS